MSALGQAIADLLRDRGAMSRAEIVIATGASKGRVLRAVKLARGEGAIRPLGRGVWEVAS